MPTNYEKLGDEWQAELLQKFEADQLYRVPEREFYAFLATKGKLWHPSYNRMVARWSESVNARRRSSNGVL